MSLLHEIYLSRKIADNPLHVLGSGQEENGSDRSYAGEHTLPDGKKLRDNVMMAPSDMVQIHYEVPFEAQDVFSKENQYSRALSLVLGHKGYAIANGMTGNPHGGLTIVMNVAPRADMGNTRNGLVVRQQEIAYDIAQAMDYVAAQVSPDGSFDLQQLNQKLDEPKTHADAATARSYVKLRSALRKLTDDYVITNTKGQNTAAQLVDNVVKTQYPESVDAGPSKPGMDTQKALRAILFRQLDAHEVRASDDAHGSLALLGALATLVSEHSPAQPGMGQIISR